jgi:hypothetical protein
MNLLALLHNFRQQHIFVLPGEAKCAIAIARQLSVEELNAERERYRKAADALIECKVHFRRSVYQYKTEFTVDRTVILADKDLSLRYLAGKVAQEILARHELEMAREKN